MRADVGMSTAWSFRTKFANWGTGWCQVVGNKGSTSSRVSSSSSPSSSSDCENPAVSRRPSNNWYLLQLSSMMVLSFKVKDVYIRNKNQKRTQHVRFLNGDNPSNHKTDTKITWPNTHHQVVHYKPWISIHEQQTCGCTDSPAALIAILFPLLLPLPSIYNPNR